MIIIIVSFDYSVYRAAVVQSSQERGLHHARAYNGTKKAAKRHPKVERTDY
jgi:hypothetical protein